jgi:gliding motility-associated-like protein
MKHYTLLIFFLLTNLSSYAQVIERFFGDSLLLETIMDSKPTPDGNLIMVGTNSNPSNPNLNDCLIFKADTFGNVLWKKRLSTINDDRFLKVIITADGNYVAIGFADAPSVYSNNCAVIYKFNATAGNIIWEKKFKNTSNGEVFNDVKEINGGLDLLLIGGYDYAPGAADGLVMNITSANGALKWSKQYDIGTTNNFAAVEIVNNAAYLIGYLIVAGSFTDGTVTKLDVSNGNIIWNKSFNIVSSFTGYNSNYFVNLINSRNNSFIVASQIGNDYNVTIGSTMHAMEVDTFGNIINEIEMRAPGYSYTNDMGLCKEYNNYYFTFHPANIYGNQSNNISAAASPVRIIRVDDLSGSSSSIKKIKKLVNSGYQSIIQPNILNNKFVGVGTSYENVNSQIGYRDAFLILSDTSLSSLNGCLIIDTSLDIISPTSNTTPFTFTSIKPITWAANNLILTETTPLILSKNACLIDTLVLDFTYVPNFCYNDSILFTDLSSSLLNKIVSWQWDFGDISSGAANASTLQNPKHLYNLAGTYTITLIATTNLGLQEIHSAVIVVDKNGQKILIPNAFSPNADEKNDCFKVISNSKLKNYEFRIFNRWGELIFSAFDLESCWNGQYNNADCDLGIYFYYMKAKTDCSQIIRKGDILLIR